MVDAQVLAMWQLGSGWMLLWGLAAALPVLIHLWSRRRYQQVPWAAMEFVLAAMRRNARRIQLEQWLLLAVRTLIVILFALALADPALSLLSSWTAGPSGGQSHILLVVDGSYSMDYRKGEKSLFDAAKEMAGQMISQGRQGDGYTLVLMGEPPRTIIGEPAFDPRDVQEELAALTLPHAGANLPASLAEVETILRQAKDKEPRLTQRQVIFLTDLGKTTWGDANSADCREQLGRIAELARLSLIDLGEPTRDNLAITRLEADQPISTLASETTFRAEIQSFSSQDQPRQSVEFFVDGVRVAEQTVDLAAGGRAGAAFAYQFETAGEHVVEGRLAGDRLALDNHRWLSVPVRESIRVLCIHGKPGETKYVALALEPRQDNQPRIRVEQAPESTLLEADLKQYDCILLCNVGRFSRDEAQALRQYLHSGGGLIFFLGDQVQSENYNQELASNDPAKRVLPAKLGAVSKGPEYQLDPLEYRHPIVAPFEGFKNAGLTTTPIWKYIELKPFPEAKTALAFQGGDAAIVEEKLQQGRSIIFATAASPESLEASPQDRWTEISSWPSFIPLVQEMLQYATSRRDEGRNLQVGDDLLGAFPATPPQTPLTMLLPDGRHERLSLVAKGDESLWSFPGGGLSGAYEARLGTPTNASQKFALNVNPRESNLERLTAELLPSQFNLDSQGDSGAPAILPGSTESFFRELLLGVLILLACESVLAWRMGRGIA
jgi:Aerotolerance regulator N-terminal/von Willebrand factor type A domain